MKIKYSLDKYVRDVLSGEQLACKWVKLACERYVRDLKYGEDRGLQFDEDVAHKLLKFFARCKHSKGEWAGQPLILEPWQQFVIGSLFAWKREDGLRRFRTGYIEVARKNGKTTAFLAATGLYLLLADGEPGAEIYSAATKRDQARISHAEATRMAKASPLIRKIVNIVRDNIHIMDTASKFEPLGADSDTMDGLNVHGALIDEIHAHKTSGVWDVLETATGSRRQPLTVAVTTAGYDRQSLCWNLHEYTEKVLTNTIQDDSWFGIIYTLDEDDEWEDEDVWVKANPNLGICKKRDDMRRLAEKAKEMPSRLNAFQRLHLNIWTQAETKWIPREHWDECGTAVDADGLRGRIAYGGLDLASTADIAAWVLVFPPQVEQEPYQVLCRFFIPEWAMHERTRKDRVPYEAWVRQGYIAATPGNVIDYDFILAQIDEDMQAYDIQEVAFDAWGASRIQTQLMELGGEDFLVQFYQGYKSMSPAMKELEKVILGHQLAHSNNPVLTWMADNLVVRQDPAGNIKPDKEKSTEKIDGMVALVMALDRSVRHEAPKRSVYEDRGLEVA